MKKLIKFLSVILAAVLLCSAPIPAQAASVSKANKKAHTAFQKQLKKEAKKYGIKKYAYADLDNDYIDELIIYRKKDDFGGCKVIYDYRNGKVKQIASLADNFKKYYAKTKVIYNGGGSYTAGNITSFDYCYYQYMNGHYKTAAIKSVFRDSSNNKIIKTRYTIGVTNVSKSKYTSYVNKLTKGVKAKNFSSLKWKKYK